MFLERVQIFLALFFEVNFHNTALVFKKRKVFITKAGFKLEIMFKISLRTGSIFDHNKACLKKLVFYCLARSFHLNCVILQPLNNAQILTRDQ